MTLKIGIFGQRYDDAEPLFIPYSKGELVYDRVGRRSMSFAALTQRAAEMGYTFEPGEIGIPTFNYLMYNSAIHLDQAGGPEKETYTSNLILNGESWSGAADATPPDDWNVISVGAEPSFVVTDGVLVCNKTIFQALGVTAGEKYIVQGRFGSGNSESTGVTLSGGFTDKESHAVPAIDDAEFSFGVTPTANTATLSLMGVMGEISVDYIRVYLESELVS